MIGGNGWQQCAAGHRHWGRLGAAGVLATDGRVVLLQHRAAWTHEGDTWAVPGGARDPGETALDTALRELAEETSLDPATLHPVEEYVDDHGGWTYTTVVARIDSVVDVDPVNAESDALAWWSPDVVPTLPLHPAFRAAWPALRDLLARVTDPEP